MLKKNRRERDAGHNKRGPKRKAELQQTTAGRLSQRDRRLSTSSEDESDGEVETRSSTSSSNTSRAQSEDEAEKEKEPVKETKEQEKKPLFDKSLSSPPSCRAAATAAGPKIASALRAERSNSIHSEPKTPKVDAQKVEKKKDKEKEMTGTKRKAEVLSDNGRVGVTISTTPKSPKSPNAPNGTGPLSPTVKLAKLSSPRPSITIDASPTTKEPHVTLSISLSPNGEAVARPGLDWREKNQSPRPLSQDEQSAKVALLSLQRGTKFSPDRSDSPTRPTPVLSPALPGSESALPPSSGTLLKRSETTGSLSDQENVNSNGQHVRKQQENHLLTPSLDYWHRKNPLVDQIFITDVTVNMMTVTIRECKTVSGFFRSRPANDQQKPDATETVGQGTDSK